jgi:uncharacterized membrane protein YagU involved in acid resistance
MNQTGIVRVVVPGTAMSLTGLYVAPLVGMPRMNPADMLSMQMGGVSALGWAAHLMIGIVLAIMYWNLFQGRLPGQAAVRGVIFSIFPWLMAQLMVMPMMGMPVFSGSVAMAIGSLIGHIVCGAVLGGTVGAKSVPASAT